MATDRTNVKFNTETYERAAGLKREGETWTALLERACDALEEDAPNSRPACDCPDDVLTTDHLDEFARYAGEKAADELEERLR